MHRVRDLEADLEPPARGYRRCTVERSPSTGRSRAGDPAQVVHRGAEFWKPDQKLGHPLELSQEAIRQLCAAFPSIEACRLEKIGLSAAMEAVAHSTLARIRARACGPGTRSEGSASASESRRAANAFQRASRSGSVSRLAMTRSSRRARSCVGNCSTGCARTSMDVGTGRRLHASVRPLLAGSRSHRSPYGFPPTQPSVGLAGTTRGGYPCLL